MRTPLKQYVVTWTEQHRRQVRVRAFNAADARRKAEAGGGQETIARRLGRTSRLRAALLGVLLVALLGGCGHPHRPPRLVPLACPPSYVCLETNARGCAWSVLQCCGESEEATRLRVQHGARCPVG